MLRFCDDFCGMLLETLSLRNDGVIRKVVSRSLKGYEDFKVEAG